MEIYKSIIEKPSIRVFCFYDKRVNRYFNYLENHVDLAGVLTCAGLFGRLI